MIISQKNEFGNTDTYGETKIFTFDHYLSTKNNLEFLQQLTNILDFKNEKDFDTIVEKINKLNFIELCDLFTIISFEDKTYDYKTFKKYIMYITLIRDLDWLETKLSYIHKKLKAHYIVNIDYTNMKINNYKIIGCEPLPINVCKRDDERDNLIISITKNQLKTLNGTKLDKIVLKKLDQKLKPSRQYA